MAISTAECAEDRPAKSDDLLTAAQWQQLDASVDKGLEFLARNQKEDGSFMSPPKGQPGITSLCVLAFLSRGHQPEQGEYGARLSRAIDFVLKAQQDDGLIFNLPVNGQVWPDKRQVAGIYNHAISALMLTEVYGMTRNETQKRIEKSIRLAIQFTRAHQLKPKPRPADKGGWRYLVMEPTHSNYSDLSVTGWQLLFLRSAKNSGFEVPDDAIESAMDFVRGVYDPDRGGFTYGNANLRRRMTPALVGCGVLSLSLGGEHDTDMAKTAGKWILDRPFDHYNQVNRVEERYHYGVYYCSQAMFQLGGDYWQKFYPPTMQVLTRNQRADGSWLPEVNGDGEMGNNYTTALSILALAPAYQLLPIYQR